MVGRGKRCMIFNKCNSFEANTRLHLNIRLTVSGHLFHKYLYCSAPQYSNDGGDGQEEEEEVDQNVIEVHSLAPTKRMNLENTLLNLMQLDHRPRNEQTSTDVSTTASRYMLTLYKYIMNYNKNKNNNIDRSLESEFDPIFWKTLRNSDTTVCLADRRVGELSSIFLDVFTTLFKVFKA
ncbi:hypothetical protein HELRODRAFT_162658 [Helobdella robusta]|uniref:TGF-beta propeptide domain-containing protein n=1 Tax=Helobdella robusta TaxID=6412 RepID=T1ESZ2_HELRO|nr:hypothetical protein HELRODRAFT_162658 [Helobdella robusta]ESN99165.1 hypothetical protein HELRODRAFT_162658 [Helobdella robusta]